MNPEIEFIKCIICGVDDTITVLPGIVKCKKCGLIYKNPRESEKKEVQYFSKIDSAEHIEQVWNDSKIKLFQEGLKLINNLLPEKRKLLDIGCGHGLFPKMAKEFGFKEVVGIEVSQIAAEFARENLGLTVYDKPIREINFPDEYFDCITFWNVIDVLSYPDKDLEETWRIIRPGGVIFFRVHNIVYQLPLKKKQKIFRMFGFSPALLHNYGFSADTFKRLLEKCNFTDISISNSKPTAGDPYKTSKYLGEWFVRLVKSSLYVLSEIIQVISLDKLFISSALTVYAKKPSKIKKILEIITRLDMGGSSEVVLSICKNSDKQKYEPILLCGYGEKAENLDKYYSTRIIPELVRNISPLEDLNAFFKIYGIIKKEQPDIIHTHSSKAGFLGRWAGWLYNITQNKNVKIIHTPHGHVFYGYFGRFKSSIYVALERMTAKITDRLVAITEGERDESLNYGIGKIGQWDIIHGGVKSLPEKLSDVREKLKISKDDLIIGTVARLEPVKGVKYFAEAIRVIDMKYPSLTCKFLIVGDGSERKKIEAIINKSGAKDKVILTGMRGDVPDLISAMDIYVQPSLNEGMGITIVFAQFLGKPIIGTKVQGIPSLIKDRERGLLVPPKNPQKLAEAIVELVKNKKLREKIAGNSKKWATESINGYRRFSEERMIHLLTELYDTIFTKKSSR